MKGVSLGYVGLNQNLKDLTARVDQHVRGQVSGPQAGLAALLADVRLLARVSPPVLGQVSRLREGLAARLADVRLFARVGQPVFGQVARLREGFAARLADVRLLARVRPHVPSQATRPREGFAARLADVRFFALAVLAAEEHRRGRHISTAAHQHRAGVTRRWRLLASAEVGREQHKAG